MSDISDDVRDIGKGLGAGLAGLAALIQSTKGRGGKMSLVSLADLGVGELLTQLAEVLNEMANLLKKVNTHAVRAYAMVEVLIDELGPILSDEAIQRVRQAATKRYADDDA